MTTGKPFDAFLSMRRFEPAREGLAERIVAAAVMRAQINEVSLLGYLRDLIASVIPKPAYALAFALLLGVLIGADVSSRDGHERFVATYDNEESML